MFLVLGIPPGSVAPRASGGTDAATTGDLWTPRPKPLVRAEPGGWGWKNSPRSAGMVAPPPWILSDLVILGGLSTCLVPSPPFYPWLGLVWWVLGPPKGKRGKTQ